MAVKMGFLVRKNNKMIDLAVNFFDHKVDIDLYIKNNE